MLTRFLETNPIFKSDYEVTYIQHQENINAGIYNQYDNVIIILENRPQELPFHVFPEREYLTAYHLGDWRMIGTSYQRPRTYIEEHHLLI